MHTPSTASTTTRPPSLSLAAVDTSLQKSTWPGESIRLMRYPAAENASMREVQAWLPGGAGRVPWGPRSPMVGCTTRSGRTTDVLATHVQKYYRVSWCAAEGPAGKTWGTHKTIVVIIFILVVFMMMFIMMTTWGKYAGCISYVQSHCSLIARTVVKSHGRRIGSD